MSSDVGDNRRQVPPGPIQRPTGRPPVSGTAAAPEGITNPPIDELLAIADSKYSLVIYAAKRARQINAYYAQLGEGLLEYVGPLVETHVHEKPLSIAMREINGGLLTAEPIEQA
jgi:DNA-directed RNA polymerase subunit omega